MPVITISFNEEFVKLGKVYCPSSFFLVSNTDRALMLLCLYHVIVEKTVTLFETCVYIMLIGKTVTSICKSVLVANDDTKFYLRVYF